MKPAGNPWMKFYPSDWRADPALRSCTIAARGLWIEMLALMHEAEPYGSLLINGARIDKKRLAALAGIRDSECTVLLLELEGFGVFSRDEDGTIYSRRMRRDAQKAAIDRTNGKLGGNPKVKGGGNPQVKPEVKAQKPEAIDHSQKEDARTDLQKREGDFRQAIVRTYGECNSPACPDTSRAGLWLSQGYDPEICLAVIAQIVPKKPNVGLSYFDQPIAEAHTKKAPARKFVNGPPPVDWDMAVKSWKMFSKWPKEAGNDPNSPACRAPVEILRKYGFEPVIPALRAM